MNTTLFEKMGLGGMDLSVLILIMLVLILALIVCLVILWSQFSKLNRKYRKFMLGQNAKSLEREIMDLFDDNQEMKAGIERNRVDIKKLYRKAEYAFQKVGLVKYDAFHEMGGHLSYVLVLLDENDNGFAINSVHSSEGCYSYSKEIVGGKCEIDLGEEEQKALAMAIQSVK